MKRKELTLIVILKIMKKWFQLLPIILIIASCKSVTTVSKEVVQTEPTSAYKQQMENLEKGIYFRGTFRGNITETEIIRKRRKCKFHSNYCACKI